MRYYLTIPDTIFMLQKNTFAKFKQHDALGTGFPTPYCLQYPYLATGIHTLGDNSPAVLPGGALTQAIDHTQLHPNSDIRHCNTRIFTRMNIQVPTNPGLPHSTSGPAGSPSRKFPSSQSPPTSHQPASLFLHRCENPPNQARSK